MTLDTGHGTPIVYQPVETQPIALDEEAFNKAVVRLVLDMDLKVMHEFEQDERLSLLASAKGVVDGARARTTAQSYARNLLAGELKLEPMEPRVIALSFAFDTVWEGVEEAVKDFANPAALRAMVVSMVGAALVMLVAPEPITKLIAIALTASLIAYLGTGPVWNLGQGFLRLMEESKNARNTSDLRDVGHRFGKVLGDNGARVLVIVALSVLGGKNATAAQSAKLPGVAHAALRAQVEGGFQLPRRGQARCNRSPSPRPEC
ncbi:hypothetical protein ACN28T_24560 [Melittangium boletus]